MIIRRFENTSPSMITWWFENTSPNFLLRCFENINFRMINRSFENTSYKLIALIFVNSKDKMILKSLENSNSHFDDDESLRPDLNHLVNEFYSFYYFQQRIRLNLSRDGSSFSRIWAPLILIFFPDYMHTNQSECLAIWLIKKRGWFYQRLIVITFIWNCS